MQKLWMIPAVMTASLMLALSAQAQTEQAGMESEQADEQSAEPETAVRIISGGVGESDEEMIDNLEGNYNVRLLLVGGPRGAYLSNVLVRFIDKSGNVVGRAVSEGPILLAELPPGSYKVEGTIGEETLGKKIKAPAKGRNEYYLRFKTGDD